MHDDFILHSANDGMIIRWNLINALFKSRQITHRIDHYLFEKIYISLSISPPPSLSLTIDFRG